MKKFIHIKKADREFLMKAFGVSERTVFNAIRYDEGRGNTELSNKIRVAAIKRGGIIMVTAPMVETLHDADHYIRQYFPNDAMLEFSTTDGGCDVFHKGDKIRHYNNVTVKEIPNIQDFAGALR
jgi:hypothetical protein